MILQITKQLTCCKHYIVGESHHNLGKADQGNGSGDINGMTGAMTDTRNTGMQECHSLTIIRAGQVDSQFIIPSRMCFYKQSNIFSQFIIPHI